ncbi:interferon-related developmental regulator-domain-containing protein [Pseudoneurospora amorphoporcata]|uniref:Interferon-related developmental regulator-domain-containing protein n=1 Tax=Pseudoneurospora amorphoporcata TaxID=241081 RepID=A0AAN6P3C8_9PEZI|nr:interferon-related developmental regulator-domain-containing protein [Pseudoneurospora amorphoporcata]
MHDLRKKALLESGKTVSRKARARPDPPRSAGALSPGDGSPASSRPGSRAPSMAGSRAGSRVPSEDEASDYEYDDAMTLSSANSVSGEDVYEDDTNNTWPERLQDRISELQDRKRSSVQGREVTLKAYVHILKHHYAQKYIERNISDINAALIRSIRSGSSDQERLFALQALTASILTCPSETIFDHVWSVLKGATEDGEEDKIKVEAINAISIAVTLGGGSSSAAEEVLDFLLEIIESDGQTVGAPDNGSVVSAALHAWAFVASYVDDLSVQSDQAMEAFMEQLDSTDSDVQTGAGVNIALLFEAARDYEEETGKNSDMQYNQHRIMTRMAEIVRDSSKTVSKSDRKQLKANFQSIITSLERGLGPGYSTAGRGAANPHTGGSKLETGAGGEEGFVEFGYREKLRIHNQSLIIDTWSLHARVETLKTVLGGGLATQYIENPAVREVLEGADVEYMAKTTKRR